MIEAQALTSTATYGNPQRSANGIDLKRLNMLLSCYRKKRRHEIKSKRCIS